MASLFVLFVMMIALGNMVKGYVAATEKMIERLLASLFRLAEYVTSVCPLTSRESAGNEPEHRVIRFSEEDFVTD